MFVAIATYVVRPGEEDAIVALHEDWQRSQQPRVEGVLSAALLKNTENTREFISIMHFENEEFVHMLKNNPEWDAWRQRLISLTEQMPVFRQYSSEWFLTTER